jgi:hypothetical protein
MMPGDAELIPALTIDLLGADNTPNIFYVVRHRQVLSNAALRALGVSNFPGRTPGLPDDDPMCSPAPQPSQLVG